MTSGSRRIDYYDRKYIEASVDAHVSFSTMSRKTGLHPTTITREVLRNRVAKEGKINLRRKRNICSHKTFCRVKNLCGIDCTRECKSCHKKECWSLCPRFEPRQCSLLNKAPYVCNGCPERAYGQLCDCEHWFYEARAAQDLSDARARESRRGIDMTQEELLKLVELVKPLLKKGQSLEHIWATHPDEITITTRTFYNYIENGIIGIYNLELPKKVKYKKRKHIPQTTPYDLKLYEGRTYADFLLLSSQEQDSVVQMDCVESSHKSRKTILTLLFKRLHFQLMMLMKEHTKAEVVHTLDTLERVLGLKTFLKIFGIILTDRGIEFKDIEGIERSCLDSGKKRCRVFFCDPMKSGQKGSCEKNHVELRKVLPKGTSFENLVEWDLARLMSHVNSYTRASLNGKSPYEIAKNELPEELFDALAIEYVKPEEVVLKPELLPHML